MTSLLLANHIITTIPRAAQLILSIGVSDAIEYYTEPRVHKYHNCPDIMQMKWEDYTPLHAALSGIKVSWHMILTAFLLIPFSSFTTNYLSIFNILVPITTRLLFRPKNYYLGHQILYFVNTTILFGSAILIAKQALTN